MFYILVVIFSLVYGIWYAINPMPSLQKKYKDEEVPQLAVRTARISGVVIAVVGVVCIVANVIREL